MKAYDITPCPAPRQTQSDKWKVRPCVQRYRDFRDEVKRQDVTVPDRYGHVIFAMEMPKSWSKKKRAEMALKPHRQKPDRDNLEKALLDAIYRHSDDSHVYDMRTTKIWWWRSGIVVMDHCGSNKYEIEVAIEQHLAQKEARSESRSFLD